MKQLIFILAFILLFATGSVFSQTIQPAPPVNPPVNNAQMNQAQQNKPKPGPIESTTKKSKTKETKVKGQKSVIGVVVNFIDWLSDGNGFVNKTQAIQALNKCQPLALKVGNGKSAKIYFVCGADGNISSSKLGELADSEVEVSGKFVKQGNYNLIVANQITRKK